MKLVIDASVALKWFLTEDSHENYLPQAAAVAATIERSDAELFAPIHWTAEVAAVLTRVEPALVDPGLVVLEDMTPTLIHGVPILRRASQLAAMFNHHLFDTLYHAVALDVGAQLVTANEVYFEKAKNLGNIQRLAEFAA